MKPKILPKIAFFDLTHFILLSEFTNGDPDRTRTCYLQIRNLALYPDELRGPDMFKNNLLSE